MEKITAQLITDYQPFFPHLDDEEMRAIKGRISNGISAAYLITGNNFKFCVILDLGKNNVHVRRIGGGFAWRWKHIENLCRVIAKRANKEKITVLAQKNFMIHAVRKLGFYRVDEEKFEKVVI